MLIERKDKVLMICEMKYYSTPFNVSSNYADHIRLRSAIFAARTNTSQAMLNTLIAPYGMVNGRYSDVFDKVVTMRDMLY